MKGKMKRLLAMMLSIAMIATNVPATLMTAKAAEGDVTVVDFCRPTTGAVLYDRDSGNVLEPTPVGLTDESLGGYYYVSTSLEGTGWKLNASNTTTPIRSGETSLYDFAGTSSSNRRSGMMLQKWGTEEKPNAQTVLNLNYSNAIAVDFTVPEAGKYLVQATYLDHKNHKPLNINVNDGALVGSNIGTTTSTTKYVTVDVGTVELQAGDYANQLSVSCSTGNYTGSMLRSVSFTKLAEPKPTPEPTAEPTLTPTVATGTVFEFDFGRPTTGVILVGGDGSMTSITDADNASVMRSWLITKSYAGTGWKINTDKTSVPLQTDSTTYAQMVATGTSKAAGALITRWKDITRTMVQMNRSHTLAMDFTVPATGKYNVVVNYLDYNRNTGANVAIYAGGSEAALTGSFPATVYADATSALIPVDLGTVTLQGGDYANTIVFTNTPSSYYGTALRSITVTKVEDGAQPTAAPTEAPTETPSVPTATPVTPTMAPSGDGKFEISFIDYDNLNGVGVDPYNAINYGEYGYYRVSKDYAAKDGSWKLKETTVPFYNNTEWYDSGYTYTGNKNVSFVSQHLSGTDALIMRGTASSVTFEFTVPVAGTYKVEAKYFEHPTAHYGSNILVNGVKTENAIPTTDGVSTPYAEDGLVRPNGVKDDRDEILLLGTVELNAGTYANTITIKDAKNYRGSMVQGFVFTKVEDGAQPTATPAPTPAGTPAPTAAPTPAPTLMPTASPMPTDAPGSNKVPFEVNMIDADINSLFTADGERFYFTKDTVGSNWSVNSGTHINHLVGTDGSTGSKARLFTATGTTVLYKNANDFILDITVPAAGRYDLSADVLPADKMGYADIYVNNVYVGTLDGLTGSDAVQNLNGVWLNEGTNAIKVRVNGKNPNKVESSNYFQFTGFNFTTPAEIATLTGIDASVEKPLMNVGDTQAITTNGNLTNGGFYRLSVAGAAVSYASTDETVATVSPEGVITALKAGTTKIVATSTLNGGCTDEINLTVKDITFDIPEINIKEGWIFTEGETLTLEPKAKLSNGKYADVALVTATYDSTDEAVAKVEDGVLYAVAPGEAKITANITYNGATLSVERNITIAPDVPEEPFVVDFTLAAPMIVDTDGTRFYYTAETAGSNWSVSSKTEAPLATSKDSLGNCRFFPTDTQSYFRLMTSKKFVINVNVPVAGNYDISASTMQITSGGYTAVYVNGLYVGTLVSYADETVEYVTQKFLGVSLHAGQNEIEIRPMRKGPGNQIYTNITNFSFTAPEEIAKLTAIDASADVEEMYVGRTEQITVDAILSNGGFYEFEYSEETIKFESSDPAVATVSDSGLIKGVSGGQVTITVTAEQSGLTDTITFDVSDAAYDKAEVNITEGEVLYVMAERELAVVATLADGTPIAQKDLTITYKSSNPDVAKVENGVLKVVAVGNVAITADVKFNVTGETKSDVKNIVAETIPLTGITARPEKKVVQELDWNGVPLIVQGVAYDGTIIDDLALAGFRQREFTYEALTPEIMTIDADGTCHYVSRGTAQIKVKALLDGVPFEQVVDVVSSSQKTGRTLYTDEMVANARYNSNNTKWGMKEVKRVSGQSFRFVYSMEHVYDLIFAEGIPRSYENSTLDAQHDVKQYCTICGVNIEVLYGGEWETNILENPWKIWCPHCKSKFPSNDFALLYERGLDENGRYNRELAYQRNAEAVARGEKDALVNELYPEKGPLWMVDDGFGWSPTSGTYGTKDRVQYTPIAKYAHDFWYQGSFSYMGYILYKIRDIYLWTGDDRYAIAGCILLDRVADVYPTFDVHTLGIGYHISHGGGNSGQVVGGIQENYLAQYYAECYDAFYPEFDRPEVIEYLSRRAAEFGLENPKTNGNLIRENIENGILRETMDAVRTCRIYGNFGFQQAAMVKAAVALDTQPETDEALTWLITPSVVTKEKIYDPTFDVYYNGRVSNTGGEFVTKYVNEIDRDGFGAEVSTTYNKIWMNSGVEIADILRNYGTDILDLYENPKFVNMYDSFIYMTAGDGYTLALGDGGKVCEAGWTTFKPEVARGYRALRTPILAQVYDAYVKGSYKDAILDVYTDQVELISSIEAAVKEHGKFKFESRNLTGYGLAMVRGGSAGTKTSTYETRYDTWMYYGRTTGSHAHWDMLQLGIDAFGFNFTPDQGYPEATGKSAHRYEWVKASISHNLVLVNEDSQTSIYTGTPLHFDSTDNVKLIDVEAPTAYEDAEIYRRTAITISANDDVAYTVDLFRVKGGNAHTYSFHTQGYKGWSTNDLNLVPQVDEHGAYVGTYASPDVPFGPDPNSTDTTYAVDPVYPRGYTWITDVNRGTDKTGDGIFTIDFKQTNFKHQVIDAVGLAMKLHAVNDFTPDSVDLGVGTVTRKDENEMIPGLDHLLIQRRGENLDSLFATVMEPYKINSYISKVEPLNATIVDGTEGENDISKVIKVTLNNNRIDYVIYATNKDVTYNVTDGNVSFDFKGFVGVYTTDYAGNNTYSYVNDGTIIGNMTSVGAYTGTVVDFTKELVLDDYIIIKPDQEIEDVSTLNNQYIYVENPGSKCNGSFRIVSAEKQGENIALYLGNCSLIEGYIDDYNLDAGFVYTIADGANFEIPVSTMEGMKFTGTNRPNVVDSNIKNTLDPSAATDVVSEESVVENEDNFVPNDGTGEGSVGVKEDSTSEDVVEPTTPPAEGDKTTEAGEGTPTPSPDATDANAGSKGMRNILLGGLGVLALGAGLFLILLGKKKDEEEA